MNSIRLADYVAQFLADHGLTQVFMVTGGGAMHLNDALGHHPELHVVFNHHEQACAMAAEGYARLTNRPAVVNVTTGPAGINALNGVFGAWTDSIPMMLISGQVKRETCMASYPGLRVRQLGDQEADIVALASPITKCATLVQDPQRIRFELERALHLATTGRPGPVWIDIPIDVQATRIVPAELEAFVAPKDTSVMELCALDAVCDDVASRLSHAVRPLVMAGKGIRLAGAEASFEALLTRLQVPVVPAWTALDLVPHNSPLYAGLPGDLGSRAGNFAVQNSDLLLVLGTRLGLRQTSYNWKSFARHACVVQVDIDDAETRKPTLHSDVKVACDVKLFIERLLHALSGHTGPTEVHRAWLRWCRDRVTRYPVVLPRQRTVREGKINPYWFGETLQALLTADDTVVCSNGTANVVGFQTARVRAGQRIVCNTGSASMGYGLPAAIGAAVALGGTRRVICLEGDGSIMMNLQELQTLIHHGWPVKVFVLNNGGYSSIRQSQQTFFKRFTGESPASGVSFPDFVRLAEAFGLRARCISDVDFAKDIAEVLAAPGPVLADVAIDPTQGFEPKLAVRVLPDGRLVSPAIEDMAPFLDAAELTTNMPAARERHE